MFNLSQLITEPTRITCNTSSILDLIFVSDSGKICNSGVLDYCISDHQLIYCTRKCVKTPFSKHSTVTIRMSKEYSKEAFENLLQQVDWSSISECTNVSQAWSIFKGKFLAVINSTAPLKTIRVKQSTEPWMSGHILQLIALRNKVFRKFKIAKDHVMYKRYVSLRNCVQYKAWCRKSVTKCLKINLF